jgi:N-terminal acetyltransferase B complex non-catalytic subunit
VANGTISEEGWNRCRSFAKEIIETGEKMNQFALRGPHLFAVELAALKLRLSSKGHEESRKEIIGHLRKAILDYGDKFSSIASCCFADLRPYLVLLVQSFESDEAAGDVSDEVTLVMKWAKGLWMLHSQHGSCNSVVEGGVSPEELRERRKKLRMYIFAIQVCYCIAAELKKSRFKGSNDHATLLVMDLLRTNTPPVSDMIAEWRTSLAFIPGVPPKDGGQKETLPGDEIVLLTSQYLQFNASSESTVARSEQHLVAAACLLEEAIEHSPFNPHLKIAAIGTYSCIKAAYRAYQHYQGMGVKYIQLDSCLYLILPLLIRGGLYTQAIQLSSSLLRFHGSTSKDIKEYSTKSFRKGYMLKAKEMVTFQTQKMRPSIQLLQAKGLIMDCAALLHASDLIGTKQKSEVRLGAEKGLCGCEVDVMRAEQLVRDAEGQFNAPSIIHASSNAASGRDFHASDNRDLTVNYFEILVQSGQSSAIDVVNESLLRGHTQSLLVHAVMATDVAKAPKKGKVPKNSAVMLSRCQSLCIALETAKQFFDTEGAETSQVDRSLWEASCELYMVIAEVIVGSGGADPADTLAERECKAAAAVKRATSILANARNALATSPNDGSIVCQLLPDRITPLFCLIETSARLFALFGWGKRKRMTKEAAGALANLALLFKDFLSDLLQKMTHFRAIDFDIDVSLDIGTDYLHQVIGHIASSREMTSDRVDPFLLQMIEALQDYENTA